MTRSKKNTDSIFRKIFKIILIGCYYAVLYIIIIMIKIRNMKDRVFRREYSKDSEIEHLVNSKKID